MARRRGVVNIPQSLLFSPHATPAVRYPLSPRSAAPYTNLLRRLPTYSRVLLNDTNASRLIYPRRAHSANLVTVTY